VIEHTSSDTRTTEHFIAAAHAWLPPRLEVSAPNGARRHELVSAEKSAKSLRFMRFNAGHSPAFFLFEDHGSPSDSIEFISVSSRDALAPVNSSFLVSSPARVPVGTGSIIVPLS
jgi:hypothetical protein